MRFEVRLNVFSKILYVFAEVLLLIYTCILFDIFRTAIANLDSTGRLVMLAIAAGVINLLIYFNFRLIDAIFILITVNRSDKTLVVRRFLLVHKTLSIKDITSWKVKTGYAKPGRIIRTLVIDYGGPKLHVPDNTYTNADTFEGFLMAYAPEKRIGK